MKPSKILFFLLTVFFLLLLVALIFPEEGIDINGKFKLQFFSPKEIFTKDTVEYLDITQILDQNEMMTDSVISVLAENVTDSNKIFVFDTIRANADSLKKSITYIEFPKGNRTILHPIFKALKKVKESGGLVRIMHYGDSQIEGDRMTSLIRNKLQKKFGGSGIGLVPASQLYDYSYSMLQQSSENWYRYTLYGNHDTTITHKRYGALASFCMFTPHTLDSITNDTNIYKAWVSFEKSNYSYSNTKSFSQCRVFYGYNSEPFLNEVYINDELYDADIVPASKELSELIWDFDEPQENMRLEFSGRISPEIYGITLDATNGVAVDNIAMRGCAGTVFTLIDFNILKEMYDKLNVKLFLLQFGGNVVPHITDDYGYYERRFYRQLNRIKKACPDASIVVLGVADMSIKEKNRYVTYPNLEKVRDALKSASLKAGAGYWDMYKAMGGKNSMPSWVLAQPPLASKDFVHFNPRGAKIIAQMFYNALIFEYNRYEKANVN